MRWTWPQVSYHLPLHRFLVSVVLEGLSRGAMLPPTLSLEDPQRFAIILAEFPIRCLALSAQVRPHHKLTTCAR